MMRNEAFSSVDWVGQCLVDEERSVAFNGAIKKVVGPNSVVLDVGTGSGIMTLFAARAGAKKVLSVEFDPFIAEIAKKNISRNNFTNIELLVGDARKIRFKKGSEFDVVIMEMITTGLVDESQVPALNNLHRQKVVDSSTVFVPFKQETYVTLVDSQQQCYGLNVEIIKHLWKWHDWSRTPQVVMSDKSLLHSLKFESPIEEKFDTTIAVKIIKTGKINALHLSSLSFLSQDIVLGDTESLNGPVLIPLEEKEVYSGDEVKVRVQYIFGGGYGNFSAELVN